MTHQKSAGVSWFLKTGFLRFLRTQIPKLITDCYSDRSASVSFSSLSLVQLLFRINPLLFWQQLCMMKSKDISSPDIGPGIRTQDSVVTSSWTTSYTTEAVSSGIRTQDSVVTSGWTTSYATEAVSSLGFRGNQRLNYHLRHGGCIKLWYSLRGVTGSSTAGYHGILGSKSRGRYPEMKYL